MLPRAAAKLAKKARETASALIEDCDILQELHWAWKTIAESLRPETVGYFYAAALGAANGRGRDPAVAVLFELYEND